MMPCALPGCGEYDIRNRLVPSEAAPGLRLCWKHRDMLAQRARRAALMWYQLGEKLAGASSSALEPKVRATRIPGLDLDEKIVERRAGIMTCLATWAGYVAEKRGLPAPEREPVALAGFLTHPRNTDWLAASQAAAEAVAELQECVYGQPEPATVQPSLTCPSCDGRVRGALRVLPAAAGGVLACDLDDQHRWEASQWLELRRLISA